VAWEFLHIRHKLSLLSLGGRAAHSPPESDGLACYLPVEWAEKQLRRVGRVEEVETGPVYTRGGAGERVICVPE
jgi:hypothetical protein